MIRNIFQRPLTRRFVILLLILLPLGIGYLIGRIGNPQPPTRAMDHQDHSGSEATQSSAVEMWTCSMHPQIRLPEPGSCPLCGMDLILVAIGEAAEGATSQITLSANARKLAGITTALAETRPAVVDIRMSGKLELDETRITTISAWIPGRLDRLFINYTGVSVRAGDPLVSLYSPELLTAQEELLQALKMKRADAARYGGLSSGDDSFGRTLQANVEAVRKKLRLWGLTDQQVQAIETAGVSTDLITIKSPISGVVLHKTAIEGNYVNIGTPIYTIADLSHLWAGLDAYESDLTWLREGQEIEFYSEAYPGEVFGGIIAFIDPVIDPRTRTAKVRVDVENPAARLKPEMFLKAIVKARIGANVQVEIPGRDGEWDHGDPLLIPAAAPLRTGKRAIVYVAKPGEEGIYTGRQVVLGPKAGEDYVVIDGLKEGEMVVVNGNFKIDSAAQIMAQPSMMEPMPAETLQGPGAPLEPANIPESFKTDLSALYDIYFEIQNALSHDDLTMASEAAGKMQKVLPRAGVKRSASSKSNAQRFGTQNLPPGARSAWDDAMGPIGEVIGRIHKTGGIESARQEFEYLSLWVTWIVNSFGSATVQPILRYHCPMAFDGRGADWLQNKEGTENPYFGSAMFQCGTEEEVIWAGHSQRDGNDHEAQ
ncbi:MAG: efflux RND transporter periplasmic adaptor subunit [Candidatus Eisenbacteria bacterium]|uniref:Efflux RND transporter periplasmic adaptor subunit n=1 Tax=Eiseniibacteriota bacterium TaxID=2212470 RepID=A0A948WCW2_UNCEI|nr:efflux RND transporter periplasmic adaptor subunit [Candidatus Eisenbacteria bacterium]MBU1948718.1 efflux RND transporter periplasmic adaptor subunit [Candidatus Eisenbacteria bacterium]MBU2691283.1 efflux RND transporter periplasmic adaptor subunit [Candidatus Eisenbacteria bacterium]